MPAVAKKKPTIVLQRTRHPLPESNRGEVVRALQPLQSGSIELFLQLKNAHWNIRGLSFGSLHNLFDATANEILQFSDALAERIAIVGGEPIATVQRLSMVPQLADAPAGMKNQDEFVKLVCDRLSYYVGMVRESISTFERNNDPVSTDICLKGLSAVEKALWLIESHQPQKG